MSMQTDATGFFGALFDFSFASFITARLIKVLYALGLILVGIGALAMLIGGLTQGVASAILMLIVAPLVFLLGAMYLRVILELLIVVFRIAENVERIANRAPPPGAV